MTTEQIIDKIEMYKNGIMRDKNEMDKVWMQANSMQLWIDQLRRILNIEK